MSREELRFECLKIAAGDWTEPGGSLKKALEIAEDFYQWVVDSRETQQDNKGATE